MKLVKTNKKNYSYSFQESDDGKTFTPDEVILSCKGKFKEEVDSEKGTGLRKPQQGALCSIKANWTISSEPLTIVLPTGTGKSDTMLATIVSEQVKRTLIVVPNILLRDQTYNNARKWGILKDIGCISEDVVNPNTICLKANFKDTEDFKDMIDKSNIIISSVSLLNKMNEDQLKYLSEQCDLLIIDEAHHIASETWSQLKKKFLLKKILQFTATPYRQDNQLVDGKIIYNFPIHTAMEQGYFKPIDFIAVEEYDDRLVDEKIAACAVYHLEADLKNGFDHTLLVRAKTINRAKFLHSEIYSKYKKFNPVIITSDNDKENKKMLNQVKNGKSKIIVCVDMFGEGIDLPNLKIAALHDKYKSLPITLQFIGRFARSKENLGTAKLIANIADVKIRDLLKDLYETDSDWNKLLPIKSEASVQNQLHLQDLISGFDNQDTEIDLKQINVSVSMKAYTYKKNITWDTDKWINVLDENQCKRYVNNDKKIIVLIEPCISSPKWTTQKDIKSVDWNYYIIYWNQNKKYVCINASDYQKGERLLKEIFGDKLTLINSEPVFRCLANIKRLTLYSVGLNSAIDGAISYKMFAGVDIAEGLSESNKSNSYKSNIFCMGYEGDGKISIGCSYKGKVWSRLSENIYFWKKWCEKVMEKILDSSNSSKILDNILIPVQINELPKDKVAYMIDFEESNIITTKNIYISSAFQSYNIIDCELRIGERDNNKQFFKLICYEEEFNFYFSLENNKYKFCFSDTDKEEPTIKIGKKSPIKLSEYFYNNLPTIWYAGEYYLKGNFILKAYTEQENFFLDSDVIVHDWKANNINIQVESQLNNDGSKKTNSIQFEIINLLKKSKEYSIIFDDDSGEIADIVAIKEINNQIIVELYHCKYSKEKKPGKRVSDLYEVCGQAVKSVYWKAKTLDLAERMKYRESMRLARNNVSRFELGNIKELNIIHKKMLNKQTKMKIFIVQPGVDSSQIDKEMRTLLGGVSCFCKDTFSVPVKLICS